MAEVGDLSALFRRPRGSREPSMNDAEQAFAAALKERHPTATMKRHGWPDFLIQDGEHVFAVEVKHRGDIVRAAQAAMFAALEAGGIKVFIWHTTEPLKLIPWRKYMPAVGKKHVRKLLQEADQAAAPSPTISAKIQAPGPRPVSV